MKIGEKGRKEDGERADGPRKTENQKWAVKVAVGDDGKKAEVAGRAVYR